MMPARSTISAVALALMLSGQGGDVAIAQSSDGNCLGVVFADRLGVARVAKSRAKVQFVRNAHEDKACPGPSAACRGRAFLTAGDVVLTSERRGDFVCATFVNSKAVETIGWLPSAALETLTPAPAPPARWVGTWRRIEAEVRIKAGLYGELGVEGTAVWGSHDPDRVRRGVVQNGEIAGKAKIVGDELFFADAPADSFANAPSTDCAVRMRRLAQYLLVEDNKACGGMNVSFSGIYVRR